MIVSLKNIYKSFKNKKVFENFSLEIGENEKVAIIGKTGVGKTTLINLILKNIEADKGQVFVTDKISVVFQENRLLEDFTAYENLNIICPMTKEKCEEYLSLMKLDGNADTLVKNLSGGMKRRLALLRALIYPCQLLILDEAVREIDDETRKVILDSIKLFLDRKTLIYISHDYDDIKKLGIEREINLDEKI